MGTTTEYHWLESILLFAGVLQEVLREELGGDARGEDHDDAPRSVQLLVVLIWAHHHDLLWHLRRVLLVALLEVLMQVVHLSCTFSHKPMEECHRMTRFKPCNAADFMHGCGIPIRPQMGFTLDPMANPSLRLFQMHHHILVGGFNPSEQYESQLG